MKGSVEVIIFNDLLRKSLDILEEKVEPVIIKGTVDPADDRTKIIAREIYPLNDIRNGSTLNIDMDESVATVENLKWLKNVFESYPGGSTVFLNIGTSEGNALIEVGNCKVMVKNELIDQLKGLLGDNSVRIS